MKYTLNIKMSTGRKLRTYEMVDIGSNTIEFSNPEVNDFKNTLKMVFNNEDTTLSSIVITEKDGQAIGQKTLQLPVTSVSYNGKTFVKEISTFAAASRVFDNSVFDEIVKANKKPSAKPSGNKKPSAAPKRDLDLIVKSKIKAKQKVASKASIMRQDIIKANSKQVEHLEVLIQKSAITDSPEFKELKGGLKGLNFTPQAFAELAKCLSKDCPEAFKALLAKLKITGNNASI
ncbi:hypothetical protein QTN94_14280 [Vibrio sp. M250220]|uniref:hypothetical protein n=1 Tax=Vibrio sp. M250220 TaxID=3020894 RepID=UPI002F42CFDF